MIRTEKELTEYVQSKGWKLVSCNPMELPCNFCAFKYDYLNCPDDICGANTFIQVDK